MRSSLFLAFLTLSSNSLSRTLSLGGAYSPFFSKRKGSFSRKDRTFMLQASFLHGTVFMRWIQSMSGILRILNNDHDELVIDINDPFL